jgi:O-acetyl-ADP-ribose deacetylase
VPRALSFADALKDEERGWADAGEESMGRIILLEGDITEQSVDAIVNAANSSLIMGSGVAGAILGRGGESIQVECEAHEPVEVGQAALTGAGRLPARFVIHAAGIELGRTAEVEDVRSSVRASLELAAGLGLRTIAFPAVGAGIGGLALQRSAEVSIEVARAHLEGATSLEEVRFVLLGEPAFRVFEMVNDAAKVAEQMVRLEKRR